MTIKPRTIYSLVAFFLSFIALTLYTLPTGVAKLIACDVGQGDSILIIKGDTQVLVDGGPRGDLDLACLARHVPFWDRTLELVVFTNTDYDHLNGLSPVLTRYQVGKIVTGDGVGESDAVAQFVDVLKSTGQHVEQVGAGDTLVVGGGKLTFHVLWPDKPNRSLLGALDPQTTLSDRTQILGVNVVKNTNERSVVLEFTEGGYKALLTGDIGEPTEKALLASHSLEHVDMLKIAHHGSKYSSSDAFLAALTPGLAVISVGAKNTYGHPTKEALTRLENVGATIRRTDQEGDIVVNLAK